MLLNETIPTTYRGSTRNPQQRREDRDREMYRINCHFLNIGFAYKKKHCNCNFSNSEPVQKMHLIRFPKFYYY